MIKGTEHMLKSTKWKKKTKEKASAQTKVRSIPPTENYYLVTYYIGLFLVASVMFWPFQETDASNPIQA